MPHSRSPFRRVFPAAFFFTAAAALVAQDKPADPIIELPKVVVTDSRDLPPPESWHYGEIPGFEILSNASAKDTQKLIHDFQEFNFALEQVWRGSEQKAVLPVSLIICGKGGKFDSFAPGQSATSDNGRVSLFLQDREHAAIVLDFEAKSINVASLAVLDAGTTDAAAEEPPPTAAAQAASSGEMEIDHNKQLYREYTHFLMSRVQPRMPAWFEEGLAQLVMGMTFDRTTITFAKLEDPNVQSISGGPEDNDFNKALEGRSLMPLQEMFSVERDSATARNPLGSTWAKQSEAFVHLCLYGEGQRYQKNFITFLLRLQKEPPGEALFKECFNKSYRDMLLTLRGYQQFSSYKSFEWRLPKGQTLPDPPLIALRDATQAEVGRIKGEALLLAGHPEAAQLELSAAYLRGERDPLLLAALGLKEKADGKDERAEKFLEAAVKGKATRPRAYLELARYRQKAALAAPAGAGGGLSAAQVNHVLEPLRAGRSQLPPMHEIYELMGDTLLRGADAPKKEDVQAMFEGVNQFKGGRLGMVYQTALLSIRAGEPKGAAALVDYGLRASPDEKTRARFAELKATLPPVPAQAASAKP